jgi:hypothetical protein
VKDRKGSYEDDLGRIGVLADAYGVAGHPSVGAFLDGRFGAAGTATAGPP